MPRTDAVDGFRLAYDDHPGDSGPVLLLHGWPGDRHDWREVVPLLAGRCRVVVPDLRGFGESEWPDAEAAEFGGAGQARSVLALVEELGAGPAVLAGYDVGSRTARTAAAARPDLVRALVLAPPLPGAGERVLAPVPQREFWYQAFHQLPLAEQLIDGSRPAVRAYLEHFWTHWSGPGYVPDPAELDRLAERLRPAGRVHGVDQLVPGGRRHRRDGAAGGGTRPRRPDRGTDDGPLARARPAVPPRLVGPGARVLRRRAGPPARRRRPLHAARGA